MSADGQTVESHHHMMTVEIESWELSVKAVNESHSLGHVNGKLDGSGCVHHKSAKVMLTQAQLIRCH